MNLSLVKVREFTEPTVCIVQFNNPKIEANGPMAGRFFQVTIDPCKLSPDGKFIRLGNNDGDELIGWQLIDWITVMSILGVWTGNEKPLLQYHPVNKVCLLIDSDRSSDKPVLG